MKTYEGKLDAKGMRFGIVIARFNEFIHFLYLIEYFFFHRSRRSKRSKVDSRDGGVFQYSPPQRTHRRNVQRCRRCGP